MAILFPCMAYSKINKRKNGKQVININITANAFFQVYLLQCKSLWNDSFKKIIFQFFPHCNPDVPNRQRVNHRDTRELQTFWQFPGLPTLSSSSAGLDCLTAVNGSLSDRADVFVLHNGRRFNDWPIRSGFSVGYLRFSADSNCKSEA